MRSRISFRPVRWRRWRSGRKRMAPSWIRSRAELQEGLLDNGFLLLNATLVYRPEIPPAKEAKAWLPFMHAVLTALAVQAESSGVAPPTLVLWGKIAGQLDQLPVSDRFPKAVSEHPYNLTFITNPVMQALFGPMQLLRKAPLAADLAAPVE